MIAVIVYGGDNPLRSAKLILFAEGDNFLVSKPFSLKNFASLRLDSICQAFSGKNECNKNIIMTTLIGDFTNPG